MILLKNVTKYYNTTNGKNYILKNVTMMLPRKNIGILGRNGAGKSTLLRMLGQIEFPTEGSIYSSCSFSWPLGLGGGFIPNMSAKDNVKFVCRVHNKNEEETRQIVKDVREFCEIGEYFDMPMRTYSSGMKSRVGFGLSLSFDFDYLLIDESLSVGDTRFKDKAKEALENKVNKCNVLMVSHSESMLKSMCDIGLLVHEGQLFYFDDIEDALKEYRKIIKKAA